MSIRILDLKKLDDSTVGIEFIEEESGEKLYETRRVYFPSKFSKKGAYIKIDASTLVVDHLFLDWDKIADKDDIKMWKKEENEIYLMSVEKAFEWGLPNRIMQKKIVQDNLKWVVVISTPNSLYDYSYHQDMKNAEKKVRWLMGVIGR